METQYDSVDSNTPAPLVFETENNENGDEEASAAIDVNVLVPKLSPRTEPKLSLSKYESVRSQSASGEATVDDLNPELGENFDEIVASEITSLGLLANERMTSSQEHIPNQGHSEGQILDIVISQGQSKGQLDCIGNLEHVPVKINRVNVVNTPKTSTPVRQHVDVRPHSGSVGFSPVDRIGSSDNTREISHDTTSHRAPIVLDPTDIRVPLVGFEMMEPRARFTIFKLHVHRGERDNWFVFRRYSDFHHLQQKLKKVFPMFHLVLPRKRWFKDNFDKAFLEERIAGLQIFIDGLLRHTDLCNSLPLQEFFCINDPPGPHDSVEESRAYCEELEESVYSLKKELRDKDSEMDLLRDELSLYKSQVEMLTKALRENNATGATNMTLPSPSSSLAECDLMVPEVDQSVPSTQNTGAEKHQLEPSIQTEIKQESVKLEAQNGHETSDINTEKTKTLANIQNKSKSRKEMVL